MVSIIMLVTLITTVPMILLCGGLFTGIFGLPALGIWEIVSLAVPNVNGPIAVIGSLLSKIVGLF